MSYTADDFVELLYRLFPKGPVWPQDEATTPNWHSLLVGLSKEFARLSAVLQSIPEALIPSATMRSELLDEWERILDLTTVPLDADRITAILAKLGQNLSPNLAELQAYAATIKASAVVTHHEYQCFVVDQSAIGDAVAGLQWLVTWTVTYDGPQDLVFEAAMRAVQPAHTTLLFVLN